MFVSKLVFVSVSICLSIFLSFCLYVSLSMSSCLSVFLFFCLSVSLSLCLSVVFCWFCFCISFNLFFGNDIKSARDWEVKYLFDIKFRYFANELISVCFLRKLPNFLEFRWLNLTFICQGLFCSFEENQIQKYITKNWHRVMINCSKFVCSKNLQIPESFWLA
jgi:hypothetical protein